jgi:VWFA-related protein
MPRFSWLRFAVALVLLLAFAATILPSRPRAAQADSRERTLFVSALDESGEPVAGLGPDAFVVREDGARREVLRVSRATEPIDIALLVDNSSAAADEIIFIREALAKFVATMAPSNQLAIVALADRPTIFVDYTSDPKRLSDGIGRLFAMPQSGMTLLDAIGEVSKGLEKRETPRAVILPIVTDGTEFTNRYSKDLVAAMTRAQAAMHVIAMGQFPYSDEQGTRERAFLLDQGPRATGGQRVTILAPSGLRDALPRIARELSSQYKVVYGRPQSLIPPEKIEVSAGKPGVTMRGAPGRGQARS